MLKEDLKQILVDVLADYGLESTLQQQIAETQVTRLQEEDEFFDLIESDEDEDGDDDSDEDEDEDDES